MTSSNKKSSKGFWQRLNDALTEVGIEHADDDRDWDQRVKLPEWQLARLKERYAKRQEQKRQQQVKQEANLKS
jgi:hypothetical protein